MERGEQRDSMSDKRKTKKFSYVDPTECSYRDTIDKDRKPR